MVCTTSLERVAVRWPSFPCTRMLLLSYDWLCIHGICCSATWVWRALVHFCLVALCGLLSVSTVPTLYNYFNWDRITLFSFSLSFFQPFLAIPKEHFVVLHKNSQAGRPLSLVLIDVCVNGWVHFCVCVWFQGWPVCIRQPISLSLAEVDSPPSHY